MTNFSMTIFTSAWRWGLQCAGALCARAHCAHWIIRPCVLCRRCLRASILYFCVLQHFYEFAHKEQTREDPRTFKMSTISECETVPSPSRSNIRKAQSSLSSAVPLMATFRLITSSPNDTSPLASKSCARNSRSQNSRSACGKRASYERTNDSRLMRPDGYSRTK